MKKEGALKKLLSIEGQHVAKNVIATAELVSGKHQVHSNYGNVHLYTSV